MSRTARISHGAVVENLQAAASAYAVAKGAMVTAADRSREAEARMLAPKAVVGLRGGGQPAFASERWLQFHAVAAEEVFALALADWREKLLALQVSALAMGGGQILAVVGKPSSRLVMAARAFVDAKTDVDGHQPPFSGPEYAGKLSAWRGALMDLDVAAQAYAAATSPQAASQNSC